MRWKATFFLILAITATLRPDEIRGKVISIADGDAITILDAANEQHRIRLEGIDAHEREAFGTKMLMKMSPRMGMPKAFQCSMSPPFTSRFGVKRNLKRCQTQNITFPDKNQGSSRSKST